MKLLVSLGILLVTVTAAANFASAQSSFPRVKPIPPRGHRGNPVRSSGSWQALTNQPTFLVCGGQPNGAANPLLLTDGSILLQDAGCQDWWRLAPDNHGSYVNGTWSQVASLPAGYSPLYHSSAVLPDGRVIIEGGEYNFFVPVWTDQGAIYDPVANVWTPVAPPAGWGSIGDAQSVVLANGTYMQANCCTTQGALLDPKTLTWTPTGAGKFDPNDEEGWTLLPNQQVLTVDAYVPIAPFPYIPNGTNSELYNPASGSWHSAGSTVVQLWDSWFTCGELNPTFELGPGVLRPDGTVFYSGSNSCPGQPGHTAIYDSHSGGWKAGPNFPGSLNVADGPAALEPNGNILIMASPGFGNTPSTFLEWDGNRLSEITGPPNASIDSSYYGDMLVLPTGQILLTDFSQDIEIFTPGGTPDERWRPIVLSTPSVLTAGNTYEITGLRFNGGSQGAAYGDDVQAATNYPLVRITNLRTGHVFYSRTHDHSSMAVASHAQVTTYYDVPRNQEPGPSKLEVVANGIPSVPLSVTIY